MAILDVAAAVLLAAGIILLVPALVLLAETLASLLPERPQPSTGGARPRVAVLVPAHDEALMIAGTIRGIQEQLAPGARLLVVADNCSDATADIAASLGAEVAIRNDPERRGKGYALAFGTRRLSEAPPDVVIVVDADCRLDPGSLEAIATRAHASGRPAQAAYEMLLPDGVVPPGLAIAGFAFKVKNGVRPGGLARLGLPCQLMGTGMAFPWRAIETADLANGELAEDLVLGLDLARAGFPAQFCPSARVTSPHPVSREGQQSQRARWEAGHLTTIFRRVPGLLLQAIRKGDVALLALALDAAVPPLALHVLLLTAVTTLALPLAALTGAFAPLLVGAGGLACLAAAVLLAWWRVGKDNLSLRELAGVPAYIVAKVPLYSHVFRGKTVSWTRSKRD